jgi:hypothetical protein
MTKVFLPIAIFAAIGYGIFCMFFYATTPVPVTNYGTHAIESHGITMAESARECGKSPMKVLYNPELDRYSAICKDSRGFWATFIYRLVGVDKEEVTSFERGSNSMSEMVDYMKSTGYTRNPPVR